MRQLSPEQYFLLRYYQLFLFSRILWLRKIALENSHDRAEDTESYKDPTGHCVGCTQTLVNGLKAIGNWFKGEKRDSYAQDVRSGRGESVTKNNVEIRMVTDKTTGKKFEEHVVNVKPLRQGNLTSDDGKHSGCTAMCYGVMGQNLSRNQSHSEDDIAEASIAAGHLKPDMTVKSGGGILRDVFGVTGNLARIQMSDQTKDQIRDKIVEKIDQGEVLHARIPGHSEIIRGYRKDVETGEISYLLHDVGYRNNKHVDAGGQFYSEKAKTNELVPTDGRKLQFIEFLNK